MTLRLALAQAGNATRGRVTVRHHMTSSTGPLLHRLANLVASRWMVLLTLVAMVLAGVVYWPGLHAGLSFDDYVFLSTARRTQGGRMLSQALFDTQNVAGSFRPGVFVLFATLTSVFGEDGAGYHVAFLAMHLISVVLVARIGHVLTRSAFGGGVAALAFALHPVAVTSVAWVAAGLTTTAPMMFVLLAWWLLVRPESTSRRWVIPSAAALCLLAAIGFREGSAAFVVPIAATTSLARGRRLWRDRWLMFALGVPIAASVGVMAINRVQISPGSTYGSLVRDWPLALWRHLLRVASPQSETHGALYLVQSVFGVALLLAPTLLAAGRRWIACWLFASHVVIVASFAVVIGGDDPRYYYFPASLLALGLGSLVPVVSSGLRKAGTPWRQTGVAVAGLVVAGAVVAWGWQGRDRVDEFVSGGPSVYQAFVDQTRREILDMPMGGTLVLANSVLDLDLFDGYYLGYLSDVLWPDRHVRVERIDLSDVDARLARLQPNERLMVYAPDKFLCAAVRRGELAVPPAAFARVEHGGIAGTHVVEVARFAPVGVGYGSVFWESDGLGRERWFVVEPFQADPVSSEWMASTGSATTVGIVSSKSSFEYEVLVHGRKVLSFSSLTLEQGGASKARTITIGPFEDPSPLAEPGRVVVRRAAGSPCQPGA